MSGKEAESKRKTSSGKVPRWVVVALLIAAIVFIFRFVFPQTVGEQVRRHVEQTLREHYKDLDVSIGSGRFEPNIGLILDDIRISVPTGTLSSRELIRVDEVVVVASANLQKLLDRENPIVTRRIIVSGVHASAWLDEEGKVSLESLWPPPKFGDVVCPRVEVRDAKIVLDNGLSDGRPIEVDFDEAVIVKQPAAVSSQSSQIASSTTITASGTATFADHFAVHATSHGGQTDLRAEVRGATFSHGLIDQLPPRYRERLQPLRGLELLADTSVILRMEPGKPIDFLTRTKIHDGRFQHPRSSIPLKDIRGIIECTPQGVSIESCQAFWGDARLTLDGHANGYSQPIRAHLDVSVFNLMLDQRFAAIIPKRLESGWRKLQPHGLIDVPQAHLKIVGNQIETDANITCKGVDLNYDKFPYPVRQMTGTLSIKGHRARSDRMSGRIGGQLMQCIFDLPTKPDSNEARVFSVAMDGPISIDNELLQALTPRGAETTKLETFIRSLNPLGAIHLVRGTIRTDDDGVKHQDMELQVSDGKLRFDKFPYPLYNVAGDIHVVDSLVTLSDFQGSNANGGLIRCGGLYRITPREDEVQPSAPVPGGPSLALDFDASRIALDEALRSSLPAASQQTWDGLWPSGVLDSLNISVTQNSPASDLELTIACRQFDARRLGSQTLRLQPTALPYRLDIIEGSVRYQGGHVFIDSIRAEHGRSLMSADGGCRRLSDGRWLLTIDVHSGSRLIPDIELTNALPEQMRGALRGLNLRGSVGLSGWTETLLSDELHPDPVFGWDLQLQFEGNRIGDVGPVHGLRGEISVQGRKNAKGLTAQGDVRIDSMHVNELQITHLRGPFQIHDDQLRLGGFGIDGAFQKPIEGRLFDGTIQMDGNVKLSDASFNVRLALRQAQVAVLLAELGQGENGLSGTLSANMGLEGLLGTRDLLRGRGRAIVENANLYQLPVLFTLFNVLSITPAEDVAFTNADIDFTLNEDQIVFNDLKLWGSLIALYGSGTLDRRREWDLTFNTRVSPRNTFTRIMRPLIDQRYTLWTVDVTGPLDDPRIERRSLDRVGETIERLFPGMNNGTELKRNDRSAGVRRMFQ